MSLQKVMFNIIDSFFMAYEKSNIRFYSKI